MSLVNFSTDCEPARSRRHVVLAWMVAWAMLLWPAMLNRYPLVFSDTGTYLSQVIERHLGWDRPVFYSLLILPLHLTLTTWPVIAAQAGLTLYVLAAALRGFAGTARLLPATVALLSVVTALPWVTSELIPDFTTALDTILLALLVIVPARFPRWERCGFALMAAALTAMHQSNLPLAVGLVAVLLPLRGWLGGTRPFGRRGMLLALAPAAGALCALSTVNLITRGSVSPSPYGSIFMLARSLEDGPAMRTLERHCPASGWRLCAVLTAGRPESADTFLWQPDSTLYRAGGPRRLSAEAGMIVATAIREQPGVMLRMALRNTLHQLGMVATGDGLNAWPDTVTPVIHRDFPAAEARRYDAARQTGGRLGVPQWFQDVQHAALLLGALATLAALGLMIGRGQPAAGLCAAILVCLVGNAAVTGALSGPHDRYESRVAWLVVFAPAVAAMALRRPGASRLSPLPGQVPAHISGPSVSSA